MRHSRGRSWRSCINNQTQAHELIIEQRDVLSSYLREELGNETLVSGRVLRCQSGQQVGRLLFEYRGMLKYPLLQLQTSDKLPGTLFIAQQVNFNALERDQIQTLPVFQKYIKLLFWNLRNYEFRPHFPIKYAFLRPKNGGNIRILF